MYAATTINTQRCHGLTTYNAKQSVDKNSIENDAKEFRYHSK